jgi:hypothetical protein
MVVSGIQAQSEMELRPLPNKVRKVPREYNVQWRISEWNVCENAMEVWEFSKLPVEFLKDISLAP